MLLLLSIMLLLLMLLSIIANHFTNSFPLVLDGVVVVEDVDDLHLDLEAQHLRDRLHDSGTLK
jgi:hypothetical protein